MLESTKILADIEHGVDSGPSSPSLEKEKTTSFLPSCYVPNFDANEICMCDNELAVPTKTKSNDLEVSQNETYGVTDGSSSNSDGCCSPDSPAPLYQRRNSSFQNFTNALRRGSNSSIGGAIRRKSSIILGNAKKTNENAREPRLPTYDFLSKQDDGKSKRSLRPSTKWWHSVFIFSLISAIACIITLWAPSPIGSRMPTDLVAQQPFSKGCQNGLESCICPRETVCADDILSMVFLTIARTSAWFDYPLYMLLFLSKAINLNNFLQKTALRCWINFSDYHRVHSLFGAVVAVESTSHSFFHILRWARRNDDIQFLWTNQTGITGMISLALCPFITLPMLLPCLKTRLSFEWRKGFHYLSIVWGASLMKHAPQRIFWLIGVPIFIYLADKMVGIFSNTHLIESAYFQRLGDTCCIISFENPPGFGKQNSAYVYLMLPWLSKYQFHAFTVFPCTKLNHSSICILKCGDWTEALMQEISAPAHKPAFVVGPFLSPFSSPAMDSENLVVVASGIGVTPAISLIKQYSSSTRKVNLIWICRDAGLVEHFASNAEFSGYGHILIYYTGGKKRSLVLLDDLSPNVVVFDGRPNLDICISGIIRSISMSDSLPMEILAMNPIISKPPAGKRLKLLLEKALDIYNMDQLFESTIDETSQVDRRQRLMSPVVNFTGVMTMMKNILGDDYEHSIDSIATNFKKVDLEGSWELNRDEFEQFITLMLEEENTVNESSISLLKPELKRMNAERYIQAHLLEAKKWVMLYCGGSEAVLSQLKACKKKYSIKLAVEKFDW